MECVRQIPYINILLIEFEFKIKLIQLFNLALSSVLLTCADASDSVYHLALCFPKLNVH